MIAIQAMVSSVSPFPHIGINGKIIDGLSMKAPNVCKSCQAKECFHSPTGKDGKEVQICKKGVNYLSISIIDFKFTILGLLIPDHHKKLSRQAKKELSGNIVEIEKIQEWRARVFESIRLIRDLIDDSFKTSFDMLHDVKTSVSTIFRNAEDLINEEKGQSFDEKIKNAGFKKKALFKSVSLLEDRLKLMELAANPKSASYGQKRPTPVYKIIDKFVKLMQPLARQKNCNIKLIGNSYNQPQAFESFGTILLTIIENAIKYSYQGQDIVVEINDIHNKVRVKVSSFSPCITYEDRKRIFEKHYRCDTSKKVCSRGSGLGLYLAKIVAKAHNIKINVSSDGSPVLLSNILHQNNHFDLEI